MWKWTEVEEILRRHDIAMPRPVAAPYEGLLFGNADMGATVFGPAERLVYRLGKMDLWDARWAEEHYVHPLPLTQLKELVYEKSRGLGEHQPLHMEVNDAWQGRGRVFPCMRMGADLVVRVAQNEPGYPLALTQLLGLADGTHRAEYALGWWQPLPRIRSVAFVSWQRNVLALRFSLDDPALGRNLSVGLWRDPLGGRSWEMLSAAARRPTDEGDVPWCDPRKDALPPAEVTFADGMAFLRQLIPGDADCPERGFCLAAGSAEPAEFRMEPSGLAVTRTAGQDTLTIFVALASEFEGPDSSRRALEILRTARAIGFDALYTEHAASWRAYWLKGAVELDSRELEREWYHSLYALATNARAGRPAPPLFGVSTICDRPPWSGDRHNNWPEFSNRFWGAFTANREEQALNYTEFVHGYLPTARRIAREVFEIEEAAAFPHCYIDGSRQHYFHFIWSYNLYLTAVHAQNCFWHYEYFGGEVFLRDLAYPVIRDCAAFYVKLVEKNPPGDYSIWPTIAAEIRGWTRNFELNRNCVEDLAHVKFLLRAAIRASEALHCDERLRARWRDLLDHLPPYPTLEIEGKEEFVDFAGQSRRPEYNCSVPLAPIWPAEDPEVLTDPRLRRIAGNTLDVSGWQDGPREAVALIRLGRHDDLWRKLPGYLSQITSWSQLKLCHHGAWSLIVNEMLLSSWDGTIRVFPCWPLEKTARFASLRTKGGFLVDATCGTGEVQSLTIRSERGGRVSLHGPWDTSAVTELATGGMVAVTRTEDVISWDTLAGESYRVRRA